jgi:F0F1-type ATP synthase delta subunit
MIFLARFATVTASTKNLKIFIKTYKISAIHRMSSTLSGILDTLFDTKPKLSNFINLKSRKTKKHSMELEC